MKTLFFSLCMRSRGLTLLPASEIEICKMWFGNQHVF